MRIPHKDKITPRLPVFAFDSNSSHPYHSWLIRCRQQIEILHICVDFVQVPHMCAVLVPRPKLKICLFHSTLLPHQNVPYTNNFIIIFSGHIFSLGSKRLAD